MVKGTRSANIGPDILTLEDYFFFQDLQTPSSSTGKDDQAFDHSNWPGITHISGSCT